VIAIAGFERSKGGLRVEFLCGHRALRAYRTLRGSIAEGVRLLSVLPDELPSAIEKLQIAGRNYQKSQEVLHGRLAAHEGALLAASGEQVGAVTFIASAVSGWDANGLKKLASAIVSKPSMIAVLVTSESPSLVVVSRSEDLPLDTGSVLQALLDRFGGKGGGKGAMAQGGGLSGTAPDILSAAKAHIRSSIVDRQ
jgi:alanyl-tRNA synthetase